MSKGAGRSIPGKWPSGFCISVIGICWLPASGGFWQSGGVMNNTEGNLSQPTSPAKVAIVTGSSRGIGAAIAKRLAADGFVVVVNYAGRAEDAQAVVAEIQAAGGRSTAIQGDVSVVADVAALFDEAEAQFGGVDVLVNNAGIIQPGLVPVADTDDALFDRLFAINVKGTFNALRLAAKRLRTGGRIVNFSTSVVGLALPGYAAYAATKSAVANADQHLCQGTARSCDHGQRRGSRADGDGPVFER
jgi:3-oxoacyl-[acyl-carrier protein] reductase